MYQENQKGSTQSFSVLFVNQIRHYIRIQNFDAFSLTKPTNCMSQFMSQYVNTKCRYVVFRNLQFSTRQKNNAMWILRKSIMVEIDTRTQSIIRMNFHDRDIDLRNNLALISQLYPPIQQLSQNSWKRDFSFLHVVRRNPHTYLTNLLYQYSLVLHQFLCVICQNV